jgi:hypothetical protein
MSADPIGYAVYCFGLLTLPFYQSKKNQNPQLQPWGEKYWSMARANALLNSRGIAGLSELNYALARCLTFVPDSTQYLFRRIKKFAQTPDQLALLHCSGELTDLLHEATNKALDSIGHADAWIKRTRFIDIAATPEDAARGPSNIRKQKASKRSVAEATMFAELSKLFENEGLNLQAENLPGSTKWREKYMSSQQLDEQNALNELAKLAEISNLGLLSDETENEDNNVEVRIIPIETSEEDVPTQNRLSINENENKNTIKNETSPKPMTILEKMRAKKEGKL